MKQNDDKYLEELLGRTRDEEPPPWLKGRIMAHIDDRRPGLYRRLLGWLFRPQTFSFRPAQLAASAVVVALAFVGGMQAERYLITDTATVSQATGDLTLERDAQANYLIGRGLLAGKKVQDALQYLAKAVQLDPNNAEYSHWQGIAYWSLGNKDQERESYANSIRENPEYLPSLLYLGHNYLESGNYTAALESYRKVLEKDPDVPEALYNRALAYQRLNEEAQEVLAFKEYLDTYRTGKWAYRAVDHLHALGDFSYRSYRIGIHRLVLNMTELLAPGYSKQKSNEVGYLAQVLNEIKDQELHIVVYNQKDRQTAKQVGLDLRKQIHEYLGSQKNITIRVSWFDTAENISDANGAGDHVSPSLLLFTRQLTADNRRNST